MRYLRISIRNYRGGTYENHQNCRRRDDGVQRHHDYPFPRCGRDFGGQICAVIRETPQKMGITAAEVSAVDKGALDCTVKARTEAAALRAGDTQADWEGLP